MLDDEKPFDRRYLMNHGRESLVVTLEVRVERDEFDGVCCFIPN
jgi:hypothetical protein